MIDVLSYSKELEKAGFSREQAELFVRSQMSMISDNVVTKSDFMTEMQEVHHRINLLDSKISLLENRLTLKLTGIMAILLGIFSGLGHFI